MSERFKRTFRKLRIGSPSRRGVVSESKTASYGPTTLPTSTSSAIESDVTAPVQSLQPDTSTQPAVSLNMPPSSSGASSEIWARAVQQVEQTDIWAKYCKIIDRKQLSNSSVSVGEHGQPVSADQALQISQLITKLEEERKSGKNQSFRDFIDKTLSVVIFVKDAGSAVAALNPYASLAWSVAQFLLSAATASHAVRRECYDALPQVLNWTTRYQLFEEVYTRGSNLGLLVPHFETTLEALYKALLNYQIVCVVSIHSKMSKVASILESEDGSAAQQALGNLEQCESNWLQLQPVVNREIDDARYEHLRAMAEALQADADALLSQVSDVYRSVTSEQRLKVLDWISPIKYQDAHQLKKRQAMLHTADWLLEHPDYLAWKESKAGGGLWLSGFMGSGKSCLVHAVIDELQSREQMPDSPNSKLAYFYCDGTDGAKKADMNSVEKILCVLVKQLADADADTRIDAQLHNVYEKSSHKSTELSQEQCYGLIVSLASSTNEIKIVIDGLDEAEPEIQRDLIKSLKHLSHLLGGKVKFFVACRPHLKNLLQDLITAAIRVQDHNRRALELMIRTKVKEATESEEFMHIYNGENEGLENRVTDTLISNAHGMFRWADMALNYLHRPPVDFWELQDRLQQLPQLKDLYELYEKMWKDNMSHLSSKSQEVVETTLLFLIYGLGYKLRLSSKEDKPIRRHIPEPQGHVYEACGFIRARKLGTVYKTSEIVSLCPGFILGFVRKSGYPLVESTEDAISLQIPHVSVVDWLTTLHSGSFGIRAGHTKLAELCLSLLLEIEELPDCEPANADGFVLYAAIAWPFHLRSRRDTGTDLEQGERLTTMVNSFLLGSPPPDAFLKWDSWMKHARLFSFTPPSNVILHDPDYSGVMRYSCVSPPSTIVACLYLDYAWKILPIDDLATWQVVQANRRSQFNLSGMAFAAMVGNRRAVQWLISQGLTPNDKNTMGWTVGHQVLAMAADFRSRDATVSDRLRLLLEQGLDLGMRSNEDQTCFDVALQYRGVDEGLVHSFLDNGYDIFQDSTFFHAESDEQSGTEQGSPQKISALEFVLKAGEDEAASVLIPHYFQRFPEKEKKAKWLSLAANTCFSYVVKSLLEHGADALQPDAAGKLPIEWAISGRMNYVKSGNIDLLAPYTLSSDYGRSRLRKASTLQIVLGECALDTVKLFFEAYGNPLIEPGLWGNNPISSVLGGLGRARRHIARYLYELGCRDEEPDHRCREWVREMRRIRNDPLFWEGLDCEP